MAAGFRWRSRRERLSLDLDRLLICDDRLDHGLVSDWAGRADESRWRSDLEVAVAAGCGQWFVSEPTLTGLLRCITWGLGRWRCGVIYDPVRYLERRPDLDSPSASGRGAGCRELC